MSGINMQFFPEGFVECLNNDEMINLIESTCKDQISRMGDDASQYEISITHEPRYKDASYGVDRPIGRAIPTGTITASATASADEAENKTMSKAVG